MSHIIAVGAGQAGASLVQKLRNLGFEGHITLIGKEAYPPYQRPPLSKAYLQGKMDLKRLFLRPFDYYKDNNITLQLDTLVENISPDQKKIITTKGELYYDHLVFTTGSYPRALPLEVGGDLQGVYTVRNVSDCDALWGEFSNDRHVLVIGGGYIGLEFAAVAVKSGLRVTLIEMSERILQRVASSETSDYFRKLHRKYGVDIREKTALKCLIGDQRVQQAELSDGTVLNIDFVVVGIGIAPYSELAEKAGCALDNGIKTDAFGETSIKNIWAAGDCASFPYQGGRIRLESVPNAIDQAEVVAENIMGAQKKYIAKPWFWSDQYNVKLQIAGLNMGYDNVVSRCAENSCSFWYYKGIKLISVDAINDPRAYMIAKRLIEAGKTADKMIVSDVTSNLKELL